MSSRPMNVDYDITEDAVEQIVAITGTAYAPKSGNSIKSTPTETFPLDPKERSSNLKDNLSLTDQSEADTTKMASRQEQDDDDKDGSFNSIDSEMIWDSEEDLDAIIASYEEELTQDIEQMDDSAYLANLQNITMVKAAKYKICK